MKYDSLCCENFIDGDCAICFNSTNNTVAPCRHIICETCIDRWYRKKSCLKCPICRQTLHSFNGKVVHDADFVMSCCGEDDHYGITLKSCTDGVIVAKIVKNDIAQISGLKKNTVITHINGIKINSHENAIKILDSAKLHKCSVYINVLKKKEKNLTKRYFSFKPW